LPFTKVSILVLMDSRVKTELRPFFLFLFILVSILVLMDSRVKTVVELGVEEVLGKFQSLF